MQGPEALLSASSLRVDVAGVPTLDGLVLATTGDRVLVLGGARALFEVAAGMRAVTRGEVRVAGVAPLAAVRSGLAASAPLDPPMPPRWTVSQYATWSARLAGYSMGDGRERAAEALVSLQLDEVAGAKLASASLAIRRATVVASAMAAGGALLLLEDPLSGLPDEAARPLARVLARALAGRRTIVFAARVALESPLALAADEAVVVDGSKVIAQGAPAQIAAAERTLALRVLGDVRAFAEALHAHGGRAQVASGLPAPVHVQLELGPLAARDVLRIAEGAGAVVIELRPLARSFA
jgi:ABC-type multidrug transport system ATPase subunit